MSDLLGGLNPEQFLRRHWQKTPLLIRGAVPGFADPFSPEELAGLACEPEVESRIVMERGGDSPWQVRYGPFAENDFTSLPETHWTLLVQEVDRHVPELLHLLDAFRFISDWRIDDVMVSYAPPGGSVGPHVDQYDVFLLQGMGKRRWQISDAPVTPDECIPGLELSILSNFTPDQEWVLGPGDMLYLPPGVAHYGVAVENCLTYSIGFRAPALSEMFIGFAEHVATGLDTTIRYRDPDLGVTDRPGEIDGATLARVRDMIRGIPLDDATIDDWFGRFITEPATGRTGAEPPSRSWSRQDVLAHLDNGRPLHRSNSSRFAYRRHDDAATLYIDGDAHELPPVQAFAAALLCEHREYGRALLDAHLQDPDFVSLLTDLVNRGHLLPEPEDD